MFRFEHQTGSLRFVDSIVLEVLVFSNKSKTYFFQNMLTAAIRPNSIGIKCGYVKSLKYILNSQPLSLGADAMILILGILQDNAHRCALMRFNVLDNNLSDHLIIVQNRKRDAPQILLPLNILCNFFLAVLIVNLFLPEKVHVRIIFIF